MTVMQLCPDDLVLAARNGSLAPQDEARLALHLARCARCQTALDVGRAFDAVLGARAGDDEIATRIAARVTARSQRRWLPHAAGGGLLLLSASIAAAAVGRETLSRWFEPAATAPSVVAPRSGPAVASNLGPLPSVGEQDAGATPQAPQAPSASLAVAVGTQARAPRAESSETAAELFAAANALRSQGKAAEAERRYLALQARYPNATEARVSLVSLARLQLGTRPALALRHFDAYLAQSAHTTLTEEALFGRARALGLLGRVDAERTAWRQLIERFPASVYVERAKARLLATP